MADAPPHRDPADPRDLPGAFAHRVDVDVRFADTDAMGHVNNAVYLTYCETARIRYWSDVTGEPLAAGHEGAESLILAEARITYRAQVFHTDIVTVETRATRIGSSSFVLEHRLTAGEPVAGPAAGRAQRLGDGPLRLRRGRRARSRSSARRAIEAFEGRRRSDVRSTRDGEPPEDRDRVLAAEPEAVDRDRVDPRLRACRAARSRGRTRGRACAGSRSAG